MSDHFQVKDTANRARGMRTFLPPIFIPLLVFQALFPDGAIPGRLGNRYQQTANRQTSTNMLGLAGHLSQVFYENAPQGYGEFSYYYGLRCIAQQNDGVTDYFLTDGTLGVPEEVAGSVRQLTNARGCSIFYQGYA